MSVTVYAYHESMCGHLSAVMLVAKTPSAGIF